MTAGETALHTCRSTPPGSACEGCRVEIAAERANVMTINMQSQPTRRRGGHVHTCPECHDNVACDDVCSTSEDLRLDDGTDRGAYVECERCKANLAKKAAQLKEWQRPSDASAHGPEITEVIWFLSGLGFVEAFRRLATHPGTDSACPHPENEVHSHGLSGGGRMISWCGACGACKHWNRETSLRHKSDGAWTMPARQRTEPAPIDRFRAELRRIMLDDPEDESDMTDWSDWPKHLEEHQRIELARLWVATQTGGEGT